MKTLCFICFSESLGGLEFNFIKLAGWLRERGHSIILFLTEGSAMSSILDKENFEIVEFKKPGKYYDIKSARLLKNKIKEKSIKNIIVTDPKDLNLAAITKTFSGKGRNLIYLQQMQIGINKKDLLHTFTFNKIDAWLTPLEFLKNQISERTRFPVAKVKIVPLSIDVDYFSEPVYSKIQAREKLNLPENAYIIGIMGRIDRLKGQDTVVKALKEVLKHQKNAIALISGDKTLNERDTYLDEINGFIEENNLTDKVFFTGFMKDTRVFYKAIDVFVMASAAETFGCVTIEAMVSGTPVIGTNTGGTPEILQKGKLGVLYTPGDYMQLADKIISYINNGQTINGVAEAAQKEAKTVYSKEKMCISIENLII